MDRITLKTVKSCTIKLTKIWEDDKCRNIAHVMKFKIYLNSCHTQMARGSDISYELTKECHGCIFFSLEEFKKLS